MTNRPTFYIIDGHALAYRQYHALPVTGFRTRAGEPTNATFGFSRVLLDLLQNDKPDYLAVSFDRGLSGREELFEDYKGTRDKMPDDLRPQLDRIEEVVAAFNIPILTQDGYEADDVIGTVVKLAEEQGVEMRIITGDRDILQLLTPHVTVQLPKRGGPDVIIDEALFREQYELEPWQLVELKGLMGDSSDNIPGVKGIGTVTATKFLKQYETIEGLYAHIDEIKGANQRKLIDGEQLAYLSRELATIQRDVPVAFALEKCVSQDYDAAVALELFRQLEFRQFTDRLEKREQLSLFADDDSSAAAEQADIGVETIIVRDEATLTAMVKTLNNADAIVWDVETTGIDQMSCDLVGIALAVDGETGYYVPVGHIQGDDMFTEAVDQLPLQTVLDALREPLTNPAIAKIAHNAAYDLVVMQRYGIDVGPVAFDTMIAEWLDNPTSKFLGLKNFAEFVLKPPVKMTEISELLGKGRKQITMDRVDIDRAAPYAAADAVITCRAAAYLRPRLEAEADLMRLYETLEMPLVPVIAAVERAGIVLDTDHLAQLSVSLADQLQALQQEIFGLSGGYGTFNINSPKQLNDVLFGKLNLSVEGLRKTTHGYSTDAATLDHLKDEHPIIRHILNYRELTKLKGTYVDALPELINAQTGRVHTSYNQTGTATGRLSSSNPNLQNIPIRTELGREVRRAFVTPPGTLLLGVDYSQIELRVLAHYSQDPTLLEAFAQGQDIHAATAATVNGIRLDDVTYEQRSFAKRVNFGLIYGMGAFRLARDSDLSLAEARNFIDEYFARLPQVKDYLDDTKQRARRGPITTLFGRRREFPTLMDERTSNQIAIQSAERVAINMPIQGTAADIMKKAMLDLYAALNQRKSGAQMILQVHDELVLEVPEDEIDTTTALVVEVMENAFALRAPLRANAEVGPNWRDMEPVN